MVIRPSDQIDIPHQLPGPLDAWNEFESHTIKLDAPYRSSTTFTLDLLESHEINAPIIQISVNNKKAGDITVERGNGKPYHLWKSEGKRSTYHLEIPSSYFDKSENSIEVESVTGSWIGIDKITLTRIPYSWELWFHIPVPWNFYLFWFFLLSAPLFIAYVASARSEKFELKPVIFSYITIGMIALSFLVMIAAVAVYIEVKTPWIVENSGRPARAFFSSRFIEDSELGWKGISNYTSYVKESHSHEASVFYATNRHGFRSLEGEKEFPDAGEAMVLGDSFVHGIYLAQNETIPYHLSQSLDGYVYNFGMVGYSTDQQYTLFKKWIDKINVNWVVLVFYANDLLYLDKHHAQKSYKPKYEINDNQVNLDKLEHSLELASVDDVYQSTDMPETHDLFCCFKKREHKVISRIFTRLKSYVRTMPYPSELLSTLIHDIRYTKIDVNVQNLEVRDEYFHSPDIFEEKLSLAFQFFKEIHTQAKEYGANFLLVYMPDVRQIVDSDHKDRSLLTKSFSRMCGEHGINCVNPAEKITKRHKFEDMYFLDDGHMSPAGASLLSELIAERMRGFSQ